MTKLETSLREAFMAQMLGDLDKVAVRFEEAETKIADRIAVATKSAANEVLSESRHSFERMMSERGEVLLKNGRHAAAQIGVAMTSGTETFIAAATTLDRKALRLAALLFMFALLAGSLGAALMYWLLVM
ncbi:hypothetical protein QTH87_25600 [Variovorax sp. J22P168]|uniref:hypothetical protein n=1 Tax=Variovorax jilinensis TaxID=3053513 RepID=UPI002579032F|nr:hypothetical protein [Variovorax sp. J22P168]MDM0015840.1 hypothetical protein [Variovorax sp. J22P168]